MKLSILGAGAWGTALALCFIRRTDIDVTLITIDEKHLEELDTFQENKTFLEGFPLPKSVKFSTIIPRDTDVLFSVGPAQEIESIAQRLAYDLDPATPVVFCSKGIFLKDHHGYLMTQLAQQHLKNPILVLSGPNLAKEVALGVPSAATLASADLELAHELAEKLQHNTMKLQVSNDPIGVQISGSMKNVFAIASGVFKGCHVGMNVQSAFYVQCLSEMEKVMSLYNGCRADTLHSLAGIGDLIATCSSPDSRNMSLGLALANGESYASYQQRKHTTTEGSFTADVLWKIKKDLTLPLCDFVYESLYGSSDEPMIDRVSTLLSSKMYLSSELEK
mgnify:CR=1 FL=1